VARFFNGESIIGIVSGAPTKKVLRKLVSNRLYLTCGVVLFVFECSAKFVMGLLQSESPNRHGPPEFIRDLSLAIRHFCKVPEEYCLIDYPIQWFLGNLTYWVRRHKNE
jgi:hypothetical protein